MIDEQHIEDLCRLASAYAFAVPPGRGADRAEKEKLQRKLQAQVKKVRQEMANEETWPKGAGSQEDGDMVQILLTERNARAFESESLRPRRLELAGPLLFGPNDTPTYILSPEKP